MIDSSRNRLSWTSLRPVLIVIAVLGMSLVMGLLASKLLLIGVVGVIVLFALVLQPAMGLVILTASALVANFAIPTGTEVELNPVTLLAPALAGLLLITAMARQRVELAASRVMLPMALFMVAGIVSMFIGNATWDTFVPRASNLMLVQLAQLAIYAFSFIAFWLSASLGGEVRWMKWMTGTFLALGGVLALMYVLPPTRAAADSLGTVALIRAPFWVMLTAVAGGQFLFNSGLKPWQRVLAGIIVLVALYYSFFQARESASNWVGVGSALAILGWLRFRRMRWLALVIILLLLLSGLIFPTVWNFAGGDDEWTGSGQSRLVLIERVLSVSVRNPVTGLGPVAYRSYAGTTPLAYGRAFWVTPQINAHNNYVDIFAQFGIIGLILLAWMAIEIGRLGNRLLGRYEDGFEASYVRGMLAAGGGALAIMMLADWILPFVYNIGFPGFQASIVFWLFLGGLVALDAHAGEEAPDMESVG